MASITLNNVWKIYNKTVLAVKDVNLVCEDGEFLALLGPSGCGKTSTLRMIAGLEEISAGEIMIGDKVVNSLRPRDRDIAMVFETYGLYPHLSVFDNIAFPLRVQGMSAEDIEKQVQRAASVVDLGDILDQYPSALGDGQKQRVSIARAIVREPEVFLFDEPISHLDETLRRRMRVEIKHLQATLGNTMVYVTHDQIEAMAMADRIVIMDLGEIQQVGTPIELYNDPINLFVAGFIGEPPMNLLNGKLIKTSGGLSFESNGFSLPIKNSTQAKVLAALETDNVIMGIRPRHIDSFFEGSNDMIPMEVYGLEPHGDYNLLSFIIGDEILLVQTGPGFFPEVGQKIYLEFSDNLHFFNAETEESIFYGQGEKNG
jgi:multiple sugar transport system ATP-binding protein